MINDNDKKRNYLDIIIRQSDTESIMPKVVKTFINAFLIILGVIKTLTKVYSQIITICMMLHQYVTYGHMIFTLINTDYCLLSIHLSIITKSVTAV